LLSCVFLACTLFAGEVSAQILLPKGSRFDFQTRVIEVPASNYGAIALHDFDGKSLETRPPLVEPLGEPPPGWPAQSLAGLEGSVNGRAEFAGRDEKRCRCRTTLGDMRKERVAALYATAEFQVSETALVGGKLLLMRVRYHDGLSVHLNGREIARRNLSADRQSATRLRGSEWELFAIPAELTGIRPGGNLLAVEVRPSSGSQSPVLDLELELAPSGKVLRGPMVQRTTDRSATIVFESDVPSKAEVEYGLSATLGMRALSAGGALARHHEVVLTGLAPGKAVHYRLVVAGRPTRSWTFHTPPERQEPVRFVVYGDTRAGNRTHAKIVSAMLQEPLDFVISTGDMVQRGSDEADWQRFFKVTAELLASVPYYPVAGNHDMGKAGDEQRRMSEIFALWPGPPERPAWGSWYSFTISGVHFVMLDSNSYEHEEQLAWVEADLKAARAAGARAIFAAVHDGPYSRGLHKGNRFAEEHYAPLLRQYGVNLLFAGHDHLYQRGEVEGLAYVVSGGAGAPLYSVRCGVSGKPRCKREDGMKKVERVHHYVLVTVFPSFISMCPKRSDRTEVEPCVRYPLAPQQAQQAAR
jgi:predicted phosphodiesterase